MVRAYLAELTREARETAIERTGRAILGKAEILARLSELVYADIGHHMDAAEFNATVVDTGFCIDPSRTAEIRAVKVKTRTLPPRRPGQPPIIVREVTLWMVDPVPAAALLADIMGWRRGGARDVHGANQLAVIVAEKRHALIEGREPVTVEAKPW